MKFDPVTKQLLGDKGLMELTGEKWAVHRRVSSLALSMEQVKVTHLSFSLEKKKKKGLLEVFFYWQIILIIFLFIQV
jgi:hypothetical protein